MTSKENGDTEKKPQITSIKQLAEHLGLSWWTVSRALNRHPEVKKETRERIFKAVEELGFLPNPLARGLVGGRTGIIGVCFQELDSPVLIKKISVLQGQLRDRDYKTLIELTQDDPQLEAEAISHFAAMRVDGVVLVGSRQAKDSPGLNLLKERKIPFVTVDPARQVSPRVVVDRPQVMKEVVEHLVGLGHRRFCLLGISPVVDFGQHRWQGLVEGFAETGLSMEKDVVLLQEPPPARHGFAEGQELANRFLQLSPRPTAVIALNDYVAVGFMNRVLKKGIKVPKEVSIVGFDNMDIAAYAVPSLTSVDQRVDKIMDAVVDLLVKQVDRQKITPRQQVRYVRPELVARESTGPAFNG